MATKEMNPKAIILVSGKMRSGKNQFATFFTDIAEYPVKETAFAKRLKEVCHVSFHELNLVKNYAYDNWDSKKDDITRAILTGVGTNLMQNLFNDNSFWAKQLLNDVKLKVDLGMLKNNFLVITDARFEPEIEIIRDYALENQIPFYVIRIERALQQTEHNKILEQHASEIMLDEYPCFSYKIENDGTLDEFKDSVCTVYNDILEDIAAYE